MRQNIKWILVKQPENLHVHTNLQPYTCTHTPGQASSRQQKHRFFYHPHLQMAIVKKSVNISSPLFFSCETQSADTDM